MIFTLLRKFKQRIIYNPSASQRVTLLLISVLLFGATGYLYFELPENPALSWADAIWWAFVTVTTVGYGDFFPSSTGGRFIVAVPLMFFGIGLLGYVLSLAASALIEAKTKELHGLSEFKFKNHLVLINFPSVDKVTRVLDELYGDPLFDKNSEIILVDSELSENPPELMNREVHFVKGDPTRDATLSRANLDDAKACIILVKDPGDSHADARNVTITLAVEARNPDVHTIVECVDFRTQELLKKAGCDGIVCLARFDAHFLTHELLNPGVQEVVDQLTSNLTGQQLYLTEYHGGDVAFVDLAKTCREMGHMALGVRQSGDTVLNVGKGFRVESGAQVITIGVKRLPEPLGG